MCALWFPRHTECVDRLTRLLLDAQHGDRGALEQFVAETEYDVRMLCRYLGDADNHDDLAQETYERAISSLHRYRAEGPAKHWLLTIARRTCADAARRRARRRRIEGRVAAFASDELDAGTPVSDRISVDELLHELDDHRRAAFVLTQLTGLRYEEAAELLGVPIGTIRSRVARARERLLGALAAAEEGDAARRDDPPEPPRGLARPHR